VVVAAVTDSKKLRLDDVEYVIGVVFKGAQGMLCEV
jgi:hypothetical protein